MHASIFFELTLVLIVAGIVSAIVKFLRQPMIIGYIFSGLILGPYFLNIVGETEALNDFSTLGIALLLFIIGLGLNPRVVKEVGKAAFYIGVGQIIFTASIGYAIAVALGFSAVEATYISIALTFSSTIIILKILSDKKETNRLYGKVSTGMLLVQDIAATIVLIVAAGLQDGGLPFSEIIVTFGYAFLILVVLAIMSIKVLPKVSSFLSDDQEFLFLFSLAWGFGVASIFALAGLSIEVGALFAGVALAPQPYATEVSSRLRPLRDFFVVLFFIVLGVELELTRFLEVLGPASIFSAFVLLGNPLIVLSIMGLLGYTRKVSFKVALTVAQISEFSLIFILLGLELGQIDQHIVSIVTLVGLITIAGSTYMMQYSEPLYNLLKNHLKIFERKKAIKAPSKKAGIDIIIIGYARGGYELVRRLINMKKNFLIVDYDPEIIQELEAEGIPTAFGDVTDVEFLDEVGATEARLVISNLTNHSANILITSHIHNSNDKVTIIPHSENPSEAADLYDHGATYVMMPHYIGSDRLSRIISRNGLKKNNFSKHKERHLRYVNRYL